MANENNDISDIVKKCKILLLDIEGTTTSISFVKDKLFPYAEENVKEFLNDQWESEDVKEVVTALRKLALEDKENSVEGVVAIPGEDATKEEQVEGLVNSVKWQMSSDRKVGPLKQLQGLIWKQGYDKGDIKGHVYDDVAPALELWRSVEGQKVYIYSSGSVQAQKLLFGQSLAGDLLKYIDGHFDTAVGAKQEAASYAAITEKIGCKPEEILFLTDIVKEAEAARASGVQAALVSREGNAALPADAAASYAVLYSLAQLAGSNKRKPPQPAQEEEQPAKVAKTDVDADVKTAAETDATETDATPEANGTPEVEPPKAETTSEAETTAKAVEASESPAPKAADEPEKMEVEEEAVPKEDTSVQTKTEEVASKVETVVEEITDSNEIADTPVADIEPVIEESSDKTEKPETDKMETESPETVAEPKENSELKNGDKDAPVAEETPPASVILEIKDITNDKEAINDVDMIDDVEPVVEEPSNADMEELQNVGESLEKECDEILSKVQDVTNLDNIPIKPLLNTIAEENLETDNMDSSDIVERILDSEMEMEIKQNAEKEKAAEQTPATKAVTEEDKSEKQECTNDDKNVTQEEKPTEKVVEEVKIAEEKVKESSPNETNSEESKETVEENKAKTENKIESKIETEISSTPVVDSQHTKEEPKSEEVKSEDKIDTEEKKVEVDKSETEGNKIEVDKSEMEKIETPAEQNNVETELVKEIEKVPEEAKPDSEPKEANETHVNGKATNGDAEIGTQNGDASKEEELSARLSMENGKEEVNGANGDSTEAVKSDTSVDVEVADIKVKTVAVDEPRNDPIEQPTEA